MSQQYSQAPDLQASATVQTVSQLTRCIKDLIEPAFSSICVQGEVSNFKQQSSGHLYFSLKDSEAQIQAVMFRSNVRGIERLPRDGDQLIAYGDLSVYPPHGKYQMVVRTVRWSGVGELLLRLHQLKEKLERMGWFEARHKKPLPRFPQRIGVVTSPTGAVIRDICHILKRRYSGFQLILNPVKVQGEGAAQEIAQAIDQFNAYDLADVLIVGRGGGSIEDLWPFNEELVADAIYRSRIPIISAVGHETDTTIADWVADVRAPTPSAAAELVAAETSQVVAWLDQMHRRLQQTLRHQLKQQLQQLASVRRHPLLASPYALLGQRIQRLDDQRTLLDGAMGRCVQRDRMRLQRIQRQLLAIQPAAQLATKKATCLRLQRALDSALLRTIAQRRDRLVSLARHLAGINPTQLLSKGYSILFSQKDGAVIVSSRSLHRDDRLRAKLCDGEVDLIVERSRDAINI